MDLLAKIVTRDPSGMPFSSSSFNSTSKSFRRKRARGSKCARLSLQLAILVVTVLIALILFQSWQFHRPRVVRGSLPFLDAEEHSKGITLVTHLSVDRLDLLETTLRIWRGPVSLGIFIKADERKEEEERIFQEFKKKYIDPRRGTGADVHYIIMSSPTYTYPVNILRNNAIRLARTELILLLDVDFFPSQGLYDHVMQHYEQYARDLKRDDNPLAIVVPAFEQVSDRSAIPADKDELINMVKGGKIKPMYAGIDEMPHVYSTMHDKWYTAESLYDVRDNPVFEPYVIVAKQRIPAYDERFIHYGLDKIQHTLHLKLLGFKFMVIPYQFIVHQKHDASSWNHDQMKMLDKVNRNLNQMMKEHRAELGR